MGGVSRGRGGEHAPMSGSRRGRGGERVKRNCEGVPLLFGCVCEVSLPHKLLKLGPKGEGGIDGPIP